MKIKLPENGTKRTVTRFLWFPKVIGNEWRWLETATWEEDYFKSTFFPMGYWLERNWCVPQSKLRKEDETLDKALALLEHGMNCLKNVVK